ncbi:hypothetical protein PFISCL1PPCAC_19381, partial [Pristionchus fissidentatus]
SDSFCEFQIQFEHKRRKSQVMLAHWIEQAQGKVPILEDTVVDVAILQQRDQIVLWMSTQYQLFSLFQVQVRVVMDDDRSIERATMEAVKKVLPNLNCRFVLVVPRVDTPLVCLTLPREASLSNFPFAPLSFNRIKDDCQLPSKEWKKFYTESGLTGAVSLIKWLKQRRDVDAEFMRRIFTSKIRIITSCAHNPGLLPHHCIRNAVGQEITADQKSNADRASLKLNKVCSKPLVFFNPLFNTDFNYTGKAAAGTLRYIAIDNKMEKGHTSRHEMHKAAKENDGRKISELFSAGFDLNQKDDSGWAPIHYAAFLGNVKALVTLLHCGCDVNLVNNSGSSSLHQAVMGVQPYIVELLLLHPKISRTIVDSKGCTPQDLGMRKSANSVGEELGKLLYLLEFLEQSPKILVTYADGTSAMMKMKSRKDTKADELLMEVLKTGLNASTKTATQLMSLFAIWIVSGDKGIQLTGSEMPGRLSGTWERMNGERTNIEMRRNEMISRREETKIILNESSNSMLLREIEQHFKEGWLEMKREDAIFMTVCLPPRMGQNLSDTLDRLPHRLRKLAKRSAEERNRLVKEIEREVSLLDPNLSFTDREIKFLGKARKSKTYGCRPYSCIVEYIMPPSENCGYLGVNEDGVHVYTFDKDYSCSYSWDNFSFVSTQSYDGSTIIQFDQYAHEVTFTALIDDSLVAASILRLCDHFSNKSRGLHQ